MPWRKAVEAEIRDAREEASRTSPNFEWLEVARVEYRNLTEEPVMISHDRSKQNGSCHPDYVIYEADYDFRVHYVLVSRTSSGELVRDDVTGHWREVRGEQWTQTEEHCEPGLEDLPPLPDNYCMVREGDRILYEGPLSAVRVTCYTAASQPDEGDGERRSVFRGRTADEQRHRPGKG